MRVKRFFPKDPTAFGLLNLVDVLGNVCVPEFPCVAASILLEHPNEPNEQTANKCAIPPQSRST